MMKSAQSWWGGAVWDCIIESWIGSAECDKLVLEEITLRGFTIGLEGETALSVKSNVPFFIIRFGIVEKLPKYHPSVSRSALRSNFWPNAIARHRCPVCWRITCCERTAEIFCNFFCSYFDAFIHRRLGRWAGKKLLHELQPSFDLPVKPSYLDYTANILILNWNS